MTMPHRPPFPFVLLALVLLGVAPVAAAQADDASWESLLRVLDALERRYLHDVDREAVLQGAIAGAVEALGDPFTEYAPPDRARVLEASRRARFGGIGARFAKEVGAPALVTRTYVGLPAARAGLAPRDHVTHVDGADVTAMTLDEVVERIRGPVGEGVRLRVRRGAAGDELDLSIVRERIVTPVVTAALLPNGVGYLRIETFENEAVAGQLAERLRDLTARGARRLVLDLRDNGGGFLRQGILVADAFLREGDLLHLRQGGVTRRAATADPVAVDLPLVVLLNGGSASASEIVAAALRDHGRATLVGERSFGKGVGQDLVPLPDGGELRLVTFEWLPPSRASVHEQGIEPHVRVADTRFAPAPEEGTPHADAPDGSGAGSAAPAGDDRAGAAPADPFAAEVDVARDAILRRALAILEAEAAEVAGATRAAPTAAAAGRAAAPAPPARP